VVVVNSNYSHDEPVSRAMRNVLATRYCARLARLVRSAESGQARNADWFESARRPTGHGIRLRPLTVAVSGFEVTFSDRTRVAPAL
jgi:hypothetical protein